jgi:hypothetical protein
MFKQAESILRDVYERYSKNGIISIYLWGSILTKDFDKEKSDIDSIAFVSDDTLIELQKTIANELAQGNVPRLHMNFVYMSEFNTGAMKGGLCAVINPRLLLLDFPHWKHVAGKSFKARDFKLKKPSYKQAIELHLQNINRRQWRDVSKVSPFERMYFIKEVARLIHVNQSKRLSENSPFSYAGILKCADKEERPVVEAVNELRANNSKISFDKFTPILQEYIDKRKPQN